MGRKGSRATSEVLQRLVDICTKELVDQLGLPEEQARIAVREAVHIFASEFGGGPLYLSQDLEYRLSKRDLDMFDRVDRGSSTLDVARERGITQRQVQIIVKHVREQGRAHIRQDSLPGFDDA